MKSRVCDICGRNLTDPEGGEVSMRTRLDSPEIIFHFALDRSDKIRYDLCSPCKDRMWRYLLAECGKGKKRHEMIDRFCNWLSDILHRLVE